MMDVITGLVIIAGVVVLGMALGWIGGKLGERVADHLERD